jgi:hypothetical protein
VKTFNQPSVMVRLGVEDAGGGQRRDGDVEAVHHAPAVAERVGDRAHDDEQQRRPEDPREVLVTQGDSHRGGEAPPHEQRAETICRKVRGAGWQSSGGEPPPGHLDHPLDYVGRRRWTRVEEPAAATAMPSQLDPTV